MLIEIRKAGFVNKGAALMVYAILDKIKKVYPNAQFAMAAGRPNSSSPYIKRAKLGLLQKPWRWRHGLQVADLACLVPQKTREKFGIVLDKELDVVLDAAGFAYGDQWGAGRTLELAKATKRWRKNGTKIILLPQALGPFSSPDIKQYMRQVVENADLICPRDPVSYKHLIDLVGQRDHIYLAPDFTNLLRGRIPEYFDPTINSFCLVPNHHMIDMTSQEQSRAYIPFMVSCAKYLLEKKSNPFILIHEGHKDMHLAQKIAKGAGGEIPIIKEDHPLNIKGILGSCQGSIGSRFHGLVSALSQGVPSLATGWSHKYKMLFKDYDFEDGLLDVTIDEKDIRKKIELIIDPDNRQKVQSVIIAKSNELKQQSENMWSKVFEILGVPIQSDQPG